MGKFMKISVILSLLIAMTASFHGSHHKFRHGRHLQFNDQRVNEIREAFDDYKSAVQKTQFDEIFELKPLRHHKKVHEKFDERLSEAAIEDMDSETAIAGPSQTARVKRVQADTTTRRTTTARFDNYDDEYEDDDEDDKNNQKVNEDSKRVQETETAEQSLTDFKMQSLGTREGVRDSFHQELRKQQETRVSYDQAAINKLIRQNVMRTKNEGLCRWPNKKVIEMPNSPSKSYMPRKYLIHRCSDDTACCGSAEKTCVAKKTVDLVLWFHVRYIGSTAYESLKVQNHTECQCVSRNHIPPQRTSRVSYTLPKTTTRRPEICKCPSHFEVEIDKEDESCGCVCKNRTECLRRVEGREGFTMTDQKCIMDQKCTQPTCSFGSYSTQTGRCPDRNDKIQRTYGRPRQ